MECWAIQNNMRQLCSRTIKWLNFYSKSFSDEVLKFVITFAVSCKRNFQQSAQVSESVSRNFSLCAVDVEWNVSEIVSKLCKQIQK